MANSKYRNKNWSAKKYYLKLKKIEFRRSPD